VGAKLDKVLMGWVVSVKEAPVGFGLTSAGIAFHFDESLRACLPHDVNKLSQVYLRGADHLC
jgi:hypothetical protein